MATKEQYVVDRQGNRTGVLADPAYYEELRAAIDELDAMRAYDEAKASADEAKPFAQAIEEIERQRQ